MPKKCTNYNFIRAHHHLVFEFNFNAHALSKLKGCYRISKFLFILGCYGSLRSQEVGLLVIRIQEGKIEADSFFYGSNL